MKTMNDVLRAALCGMLLLAGCSGATSVHSGYVAPTYTTTEYGVGAGRKDLKVEVRGDPFGMGEAAFDAAVVEALQRHQPRPQPTRFTLAPGESANPAYRTVLLFDAPAAVNAISACRGDVPVAETTPDRVRVSAMFCRNAGTLTKVTGEVDQVSSVQDTKFDALMQQIVVELFPLKEPQDDDEPSIIVP